MEIEYIIIQAGGKGTRMQQLTYNKPKALVPVDNLPMIFHLFRKYPKKKYIVIGDYKYEVLEKYLSAFAEISFVMVDARGKKGTCAGLLDALELIPKDAPFMLIWSDLILSKDYEMPIADGNYIGLSKDFVCRWKYEKHIFLEERSSEYGVAGHFIFKNKRLICDVPKEGEFVAWLQHKNIQFRTIPLYHTKEYGLFAEYEKLEKKKCRPFNRITFLEDCILKEGIDEQGMQLAKREIKWYQFVQENHFVQIPKIYDYEPLRMEKINGKNIYEYQENQIDRQEILSQIITSLKAIHSSKVVETDQSSYDEAYIGKTFKRLDKIKKLVPFAQDTVITINGKKCRNVFDMKEELVLKVKQFIPQNFCLIHGDCTFSNILLKEDKTPIFIDPRGYFGFTELYGDPAYDWVKLYYSLAGDYDQFNQKNFILKIDENEVRIEIATNGWKDMEDTFFSLLKNEISKEQIQILHAIMWLSLTTYAWEDYDSICGAFYRGVYLLNETIPNK